MTWANRSVAQRGFLQARNYLRMSPLQRLARRGFVNERATDTVLIDKLISPLRYDIETRIEFFDFHGAHGELYRADRALYMSLAFQQPYYFWFSRIAAPYRHGTTTCSIPGFIETRYVEQVDRSVALYESFEANGYDSRSPVVLQTADVIVRPATGHVPAGRLFAGDGCHRLALLRRAGWRVLTPNDYIVRRLPTLSPLDTTSCYVEAGELGGPVYEAFLKRGQAVREVQHRDPVLTRSRGR